MTLDKALDPRWNSLNVLRLVLAAMVLVSHAFSLTGRPEPTIGSTTLGTVAVCGFFAISGYLICGSRMHTSAGRYLWHRLLRIFPAFWVCLGVTAFVFAPLEYWREHRHLAGFPVIDGAKYATVNAALAIRQWGIDGTLAHHPYPSIWDGSLWTLVYEFTCYMAVLCVASFGLLRRPKAALVMAGVVVAVDLLPDSLLRRAQLGWLMNADDLFNLGVMFVAGAGLYLMADRVPIRWWFAGASAAATVVALAVLDHPNALIALPLAYLVLWLGCRVPLQGLFRRNDISYGVYIYAFPVQQLIATTALASYGIVVDLAAVAALTVALAALSWFLIERNALALKDVSFGHPDAEVIAA